MCTLNTIIHSAKILFPQGFTSINLRRPCLFLKFKGYTPSREETIEFVTLITRDLDMLKKLVISRSLWLVVYKLIQEVLL